MIFESTNLSRDNLGREIGRSCLDGQFWRGPRPDGRMHPAGPTKTTRIGSNRAAAERYSIQGVKIHREFPGRFESSDRSRDDLGRENERMCCEVAFDCPNVEIHTGSEQG